MVVVKVEPFRSGSIRSGFTIVDDDERLDRRKDGVKVVGDAEGVRGFFFKSLVGCCALERVLRCRCRACRTFVLGSRVASRPVVCMLVNVQRTC